MGNKDLADGYSPFTMEVRGDCLDSEFSPMRVKNGYWLGIHRVDINFTNLLNSLHKLIVIRFSEKDFAVKELYRFFYPNAIEVCFYVPKFETFVIPVNKIRAFYVVDEVIPK